MADKAIFKGKWGTLMHEALQDTENEVVGQSGTSTAARDILEKKGDTEQDEEVAAYQNAGGQQSPESSTAIETDTSPKLTATQKNKVNTSEKLSARANVMRKLLERTGTVGSIKQGETASISEIYKSERDYEPTVQNGGSPESWRSASP